MGGRDRLDLWLARTASEPALDPELPIIDPHHHLWNRGGHRYLADELKRDLDCGHKFIATTFVECLTHYRPDGPMELRPAGEIEFVTKELATPLSTAQGSVNAGAAIIAWADLALGDRVETVLDVFENVASGRLQGIRFATAWHAGDAIRSHYPTTRGMLACDGIISGIRALGRRELTFEVWAYFTQLNEVAEAARKCPDTTFVVNHCGGILGVGPWRNKRSEIFEVWSTELAKVAVHDNVLIKLGGLGMPIVGFEFHKRDRPPTSKELATAWWPYIARCLELFTPNRAMFESNWPVDRTASHYSTVWNAFKRLTLSFSQNERAKIFSDVAAKTYKIAQN